MKNLQSVTVRIAVIISMIALLAVSCEPETVTVKVESIEIANASPLTLTVGDTDTLRVNILPSDATNLNYEVTVADESVVTVSEANLITAVAAGTTTISAKAEDGGLLDVLEVVVLPVEEPKELEFTFELKSVDETSAVVVVTPSDPEAMFFADAKDMDFFEGYAAIGEACADMIASHKGAGTISTHMYAGYQEIEFSCEPDTDYMLVAVGYEDDQMTSAVYEFVFKTAAEVEDGLTFKFEPDGTVVTIIPSDENVMYFAEAMDKPWYEEYGTPETACAAVIEMYEEWGMLDLYMVSGVYDLDLSLMGGAPGDEYVILAVGYEDGQMTSKVASFTYTISEDGSGNGSGDDEQYDIDFKGVAIVMEDYSGDGSEMLYNIYDIPVEEVVDETMYMSLDLFTKEPYKIDGTFGPEDFYLGFSAYLNPTWETFEAFEDCNMTVTKKDDGTYDLLATGVLQNGKTVRITYSGPISVE